MLTKNLKFIHYSIDSVFKRSFTFSFFRLSNLQGEYLQKRFQNNSSIQFNSKTLFKDGDPVSLQFIFPGAIHKL